MEGRDDINRELFQAEIKSTADLLRVNYAACDKLNSFLQALQKLLTKDAPHNIRPTKVAVVGAYMLHTVLKLSPRVDLSVTVPESWCSIEEIRKHGWLSARRRYVEALRENLTAKQLVVSVQEARGKGWVCIEGPPASDGERWKVHLHPSLPAIPTVMEYVKSPATFRMSPYYTQAVLEDTILPSLLPRLHAAFSASPALSDTMLLVKLWAYKQGLDDSDDGLSSTILSMLMVHLLDVGSINPTMTPSQCLRMVIQYLADLPKFIDLSPPSEQLKSPMNDHMRALLGEMKKVSPVVMLYEGWNMFFRSTEQAVEEIKALAKRTISLLNTANASAAVHQCFRTPNPFWLRHDFYLTTPAPTRPLTKLHDASQTIKQDFRVMFSDMVTKALPDRFRRTRCRYYGDQAVLGITLPTADVLRERRVEGPILTEKEKIAEFNNLWGTDRTTNIQCDDGIIRRVAVFKEAEDGLHFILLVARTLLSRHFSLPADRVEIAGRLATHPLSVPTDVSKSDGARYDPMQLLNNHIQAAFQELCAHLQGLDKFPVQILQVDPAHSALSRTCVAPPHPHNALLRHTDPKLPDHLVGYGPGIEPMEVVITFGHTNAWPDHLDAVEHIKASFHLKIAERLRKEWRLVCVPRKECIDVLLHGLVFRCYIYHAKEVALLEGLGQVAKARVLERQLGLLPQHTKLMNGYALGFSAFGPAVRLLKRWASAHLMAGFINDAALELIMANVFAQKNPPRTALLGFARALHLITSWSWDTMALPVPIVSGDPHQLPTKKPKGASDMWIVTPYSPNNSVFTLANPLGAIFKRLQALAERSLVLYFDSMKDFTTETWDKWSAMFTTSLKPYDMLLQLERGVVPHPKFSLHSEAIRNTAKPTPEELESRGSIYRPGCTTRQEELHRMVDYNPLAWFLNKLRVMFKSTMLFAHDTFGGAVIAAVSLQPLSAEESALLAEHFQGMGTGIVRKVQVSASLTKAIEQKSPKSSPKSAPTAGPTKGRKAVKREVEVDEKAEAEPAAPPAPRPLKKKKKKATQGDEDATERLPEPAPKVVKKAAATSTNGKAGKMRKRKKVAASA